MHVEGDGNRNFRRNPSDAGEQLSLAVLETLGHHGAVQVEHDRIAAGLDRFADGMRDGLVGRVLYGCARRGAGGDRRHDLPALPLRDIDEGRHRRPGALIGIECSPAARRQGCTAREATDWCRHWRERVGLVLHHGDDDAHGISLTHDV